MRRSKTGQIFKTREVYKKDRFEDLWTIFPPGTLIYGKAFQDQDQLLLVQGIKWTWPRQSSPRQPWELRCWPYDWTGKLFRRTCFSLLFEYYDGYRPITALPYFPFEFHTEYKTTREKLIERGKDFRTLCKAKAGSRLFEYNGNIVFGGKGKLSGKIRPGDDGVLYLEREILELNPPKSAHVSSIVVLNCLEKTNSWFR